MRFNVTVNGENAPAWMFVAPAFTVGLNGRVAPGHGPPPGPWSMLNDDSEVTGPLPSHGVKTAVVVYVPHRVGVASGARSPPKKCSSRFSNGRSGVFLNVVTICPVCGFNDTSPASLIKLPEYGVFRDDIHRHETPERVRVLAARYTEPSSSCSNSGVLIFTVPTFDPSGQKLDPGASGLASSERERVPLHARFVFGLFSSSWPL